MNGEQAVRAYIDRFGGFPIFLMMGVKEDVLVHRIEEALESGIEIQMDENHVY